MSKLLKRSEVNQQDTWDLTRLFKTEADYEAALVEIATLTDEFAAKYEGKITTAAVVNAAYDDYRVWLTKFYYVSGYQSLAIAGDQTDEENALRSGRFGSFYAEQIKKIIFFNNEVQELDPEILKQAAVESTENKRTIEEVIKGLKHKLAPAVEVALAEFSQVLSAPYENYEKFKLSDMTFDPFEVDGKTYEQSFASFENGFQTNSDPAVRHAAFANFYDKLGQYENGLANNYKTHVLTEKAYANLKNFPTVFDYLLDDQDVSMELYDRQIDVIMEHLAPPMRKYAKLVQKVHGLDKMTFADLQLDLDSTFEPTITVADSKKYSIDGLSILGPDYAEMIEKSFTERWIDFPQSIGKSTGGFCASPYRKGSYILLNWNDRMDEVLVLAHELGHAGHFYFAGQAQNIFDTDVSTYFVEAPSTMNEIIMAEHLINQSDDPRFKRWVLSAMVSRTYYHNCVTHLLEAHYQREVYRCVEKGEPITANVLNELKLATLREFWGDAVEIQDYAGRTWMRQPHYFLGLYPYTYSAGLTVATAAFKKIKNGELTVEKWLDVLKAGGSKDPLELAMMADVDLSTEAPLRAMIDYVDEMVGEMIALTEQL